MTWGQIGQPGQRETIRGGRDQDLLTPFWQTVALIVLVWWSLMWLVFMAIGIGPGVFYAVSWGILGTRVYHWAKVRRLIDWRAFLVAATAHTVVPFALERVWMDYSLPWAPWFKVLWFGLCCAAIVPPGLFIVVIWYRLIDPNSPPPRTAIERHAPIRPWAPEPSEKAQIEVVEIPGRAIEFSRRRKTEDGNGWDYGEIPNINTLEWWSYVRRIVFDYAGNGKRNPITWSEPCAERFNIKPSEFRETRDALIDARLLRWIDPENHRLGATFVEEEMEFWIEYISPPPPQERAWFVQELETRGLLNE